MITYRRFLELLKRTDSVVELSVDMTDTDVHFRQVDPLR